MKTALFLLVVFSWPTSAFSHEGSTDIRSEATVHAPAQNVKYEYYDVCGCSEEDLKCDLQKKAILCSDGKKYDSTTSWKVSWDHDYYRSASSCAVRGYQVTVDIVIRLPKWVRDVNATQQFIDKWDRYIKNLIIHENGHRDLALDAAWELTDLISDISPARTCGELDRTINKISRTRLQKLIAEQKEYDAVTKHGIVQGVLYP